MRPGDDKDSGPERASPEPAASDRAHDGTGTAGFAEVASALRGIVQESGGGEPVNTAGNMLYKRVAGAKALVKKAGGLKAFCESCSGLTFVDAAEVGFGISEIRLEQQPGSRVTQRKPGRAQTLCRFFGGPKGCRNGSDCPFLHAAKAPAQAARRDRSRSPPGKQGTSLMEMLNHAVSRWGVEPAAAQNAMQEASDCDVSVLRKAMDLFEAMMVINESRSDVRNPTGLLIKQCRDAVSGFGQSRGAPSTAAGIHHPPGMPMTHERMQRALRRILDEAGTSGINAPQVPTHFFQLTGAKLSCRAFGHERLLDLLESMPSVCTVTLEPHSSVPVVRAAYIRAATGGSGRKGDGDGPLVSPRLRVSREAPKPPGWRDGDPLP